MQTLEIRPVGAAQQVGANTLHAPETPRTLAEGQAAPFIGAITNPCPTPILCREWGPNGEWKCKKSPGCPLASASFEIPQQ
jgi:hypothetical protein